MVSMVASSVHGEWHKAWQRAAKNIFKTKYASNYHRKLQYALNFVSNYSLDGVLNDYFLDLGLFPGDRKICADALLDIWVYVRNLQMHHAFAILSELESRNLLKSTSNSKGSTDISYGNGIASELYFSQHDGTQDLVPFLGPHNNIQHWKRLVIEMKNFGSSEKWELLRYGALRTQILSILNGPMEEKDWYDMDFPETEALFLFFSSTEYSLPPFLKSMKKLKFLMISNCGTEKATVKGFNALSSLTHLKSLRLERLILPFDGKQSIEVVQNIEKLSLSLCEGFENISTFTKLQYFNLDHSNDLEEIPLGIYNMPYIISCSITNCHQLQYLSYDFGNMRNLRMLKLSALPCLEQLPESIGKLEQLEYLDISQCEGLKKIPKEIGKLKNLKEVDMRECSRLRMLPADVCELSSLKRVICDETIGKQWLRVKNTCIPLLRVQIVEASFSLDWLDD